MRQVVVRLAIVHGKDKRLEVERVIVRRDFHCVRAQWKGNALGTQRILAIEVVGGFGNGTIVHGHTGRSRDQKVDAAHSEFGSGFKGNTVRLAKVRALDGNIVGHDGICIGIDHADQFDLARHGEFLTHDLTRFVEQGLARIAERRHQRIQGILNALNLALARSQRHVGDGCFALAWKRLATGKMKYHLPVHCWSRLHFGRH
jgi:hypothetical protein